MATQRTPEPQPLRRDAERNRDRILAAARHAYADEGVHVSMASVARQAGVGIATLFRRFATREELIEAAFADTMNAYVEAVETALSDPAPWHGFTVFIETVCGMQSANRGFAEVLTMTFPTAKSLESKRSAALRGFAELIERAKSTGGLRPEFRPEDLVVVLMANAGVIAAAGDAAPAAGRRLIGYLLDAFATGESPALPPTPDARALEAAMIQLADRNGSNA